MNTPTVDENMLDPRLQKLLEQAYPGPECPAPEAFLSDAQLTAAERARIDAHAQTCPACAAERELALAFAADGALSADAQSIVDELRARAPWHASTSRAVSRPAFGRGRASRWPRHSTFLALPLAMAAALVLAVGALLQFGGVGAPPIAPPGTGVAMRGSEIEIVAPSGEIAAIPDELRWNDVPAAASYHVRIVGVDGEELWSATVSGSPATLESSARSAMHGAVLYRWQVEALDANGSRLAWSKLAPFRIQPNTGGQGGE